MTEQSARAGTEPLAGDAFGQAVRRAWRAGGAPGVAHEVIERDDGLLTINDIAKYFADPAEWNTVERLALERASGRVLDVGCGPGRHAVHLMKRGAEVLGVEPSPGAAEVARLRGVEVIEATAETLDESHGTFSAVLLGGQNIGLLGSREAAPGLLRSLAALTRPGGSLLGVGIDSSRLRSSAHVAYAERNEAAGRMRGQQRFRIRDGNVAGAWFNYLLASPAELRELVEGSPWRLHDLVSDGPHYLAHLVTSN